MGTEELKPSLRTRQKRRDKRMGEEAIECYRRGMWTKRAKGSMRRMHRLGLADLRSHEGIKAIHTGERRHPSDNLEPLIRYLRSKVGKHWDKVHAELCHALDGNSLTGQHVRDHLRDFVHTKVIKEGKRMISHDRGRPLDLLDHPWGWPRFYVHPKSGVLTEVKPERKVRRPNIRK